MINHKPLEVKHCPFTQANIPTTVGPDTLSPSLIMEPDSETLPSQQLLALTPALHLSLVHIQPAAS